MPVYKVKPENAKGPIKTIHRNLLLPIDVIPSKSDNVSQIFMKLNLNNQSDKCIQIKILMRTY